MFAVKVDDCGKTQGAPLSRAALAGIGQFPIFANRPQATCTDCLAPGRPITSRSALYQGDAGRQGMSIIVGTGEYRYRIIEDWAQLPEGWSFKEVVAVKVASTTKIYTLALRDALL